MRNFCTGCCCNQMSKSTNLLRYIIDSVIPEVAIIFTTAMLAIYFNNTFKPSPLSLFIILIILIMALIFKAIWGKKPSI